MKNFYLSCSSDLYLFKECSQITRESLVNWIFLTTQSFPDLRGSFNWNKWWHYMTIKCNQQKKSSLGVSQSDKPLQAMLIPTKFQGCWRGFLHIISYSKTVQLRNNSSGNVPPPYDQKFSKRPCGSFIQPCFHHSLDSNWFHYDILPKKKKKVHINETSWGVSHPYIDYIFFKGNLI